MSMLFVGQGGAYFRIGGGWGLSIDTARCCVGHVCIQSSLELRFSHLEYNISV